MVWQWHLDIQADRLKLPVRLVENSINGHDLALTGEGQLGESLSRFITAQGLEMRPSSSAFARLKRECQILHHERTGGYYGEIDSRREATVKILDAIETLEIEPQQIAAFIEAKPVEFPHGKVGMRPYPWPALIADWARETRAKEKTEYSWTKIISKLTVHLGHDDAAAVRPDRLERQAGLLGAEPHDNQELPHNLAEVL